jgi:hypothetical protein
MSTDYTPNTDNAPADIPKAEIDRSLIRRLVVHYRDKGSDMYGIEFHWAVLDSSPAGIDDLVHIVFDPVSPCIFDFDESQRDNTCYFAMRWESTGGKKGPWSGIYSAQIP